MPFFTIDNGALPSSVVPLYARVGDTEQEEAFSQFGVIWQFGSTEHARRNRAKILHAAKKNNVSLENLCDSLSLKWSDLIEWVDGEQNALEVFVERKKRGVIENHAWYDEFRTKTELLMRLLAMPLHFRIPD